MKSMIRSKRLFCTDSFGDETFYALENECETAKAEIAKDTACDDFLNAEFRPVTDDDVEHEMRFSRRNGRDFHAQSRETLVALAMHDIQRIRDTDDVVGRDHSWAARAWGQICGPASGDRYANQGLHFESPDGRWVVRPVFSGLADALETAGWSERYVD